MGFEVRVKLLNGKCLFTEGWSDFVGAERISRNDTAVFSCLGSNTIGMRLYGPTGSERPLANRPPIGHPMLQDFVAVPGQPAAIGMNVPGQFDGNTLKCQTFRTWYM
jgi:hypothetical protein